MNKNIEIPLSKTKIVLMLLGCIAFVMACVWLYNYAEQQEQYSSVLLKGIGGVGFVLFGVFGIFSGKKLFDKKPGLVISSKGIVDNTSSISVKLIEWKDILGFDVLQIQRTRLLLVKVRKPQKYIDKATNNAQKRILKLNAKEYGTPVHITANSLQISFDELHNLLVKEHQKRKK